MDGAVGGGGDPEHGWVRRWWWRRGHADARGKEDYNANLSDKRAQAVMDYLVDEHDIDPDRLEWTGKGESEPYDPANPDADVNRRVEFKNITGTPSCSVHSTSRSWAR